jgi:hypothetical protein
MSSAGRLRRNQKMKMSWTRIRQKKWEMMTIPQTKKPHHLKTRYGLAISLSLDKVMLYVLELWLLFSIFQDS